MRRKQRTEVTRVSHYSIHNSSLSHMYTALDDTASSDKITTSDTYRAGDTLEIRNHLEQVAYEEVVRIIGVVYCKSVT